MLNKDLKTKLIENFAQSEKDSGSCQVQIAVLSERINQISQHLKSFPKDKASIFGLVKLVGKRKSFLNYLEKNNKKAYEDLKKKLAEKGYMQ